jgi:hypothetical protein
MDEKNDSYFWNSFLEVPDIVLQLHHLKEVMELVFQLSLNDSPRGFNATFLEIDA